MINFNLIYKNLSSYKDAILNFIYPPYCIICTNRLESDKFTCEECWQNLPRLNHLDAEYPSSETALKKIPDSLAVFSVWEYSDKVQKLIHEMKYFRKLSLAAKIGDEMAMLVMACQEYTKADVIIPVPLHKTKLRERGFNQSLLLADRISKGLNVPRDSQILKRIRYTKSQSKLNAEERIKNVQGAFEVIYPKRLKKKVVILVDDVLTTGSTLNACALVLKNAGAYKMLAVTAAKVN